MSVIIQKNSVCAKEVIFEILQHVVAKMENIIGDSVITCDEIIEETIPRKCIATTTVVTKCISTNFYTLLAFLLMAIAVSIYSYLIIYQTKQNLCYIATTPLAT